MGVIILADYDIVDPRSVFRGLTYGQWVGVWYNNLMSERPDIVYREGNSIAFLRGNVEYQKEDVDGKQDVDGKREVFSTLTREHRLRIQEDTAVLVPVITTQIQIGDEYQGEVLNSQLALRAAARRDTVNGGEIAARIKKYPSDTMTRLVPDLNDFYIETVLFPLSVPASSAYRRTIEGTPIEPGQYQALVAGIFVIIVNLKEGVYRIAFSGRGVGNYLTKSEYDIRVYKGRARLDDVSGEGGPSLLGFDNPLGFVAKWKDKESII